MATVPKRGYRFIEDVVRERAGLSREPLLSEHPRKKTLFQRNLLLFVIAGSIILPIFIYGIFFHQRGTSGGNYKRLKDYYSSQGLTPVFYMDYQDSTSPGQRIWYRIDNHQWAEHQPDGTEDIFDEIDRITVEGENGTQVRNIVTKLEIFVPDRDQTGRTVFWRRSSTEPWLYFSEAVYTED